MRKKLLAGIGAAALIALTFPTSANAASEMLSESLPEPIGVDSSQIEREFTAVTPGEISGVTVSVDFMTHDGVDCLVPPTDGISYPEELGIGLISPAGTVVNLVKPWEYDEALEEYYEGTYPGWEAPPVRVQVTFDDAAVEVVGVSNGGTPITGTFKPVEPLSAFVGEEAAGVWRLVFADIAGSDPKCYYGATLNIETAVDEVPVDVVPVDEVKPPVIRPTPPAKIETAA